MAEPILICPVDDLSPNQALRVTVGEQAIALVKDSNGDVHAIGDLCTHGDISLAEGFVEGCTLECWAHGSKFDLKTGYPLTLPAFEPVPVYPVEIREGNIYLTPEGQILPKP